MHNEKGGFLKSYNITEEVLSAKEMSFVLAAVTGHIYTFARGGSRIWGEGGNEEDMQIGSGGFYQLMPHTADDGFFQWYCYHRDNEQWFETMGNCVIHFIFYWTKWNKLGKPLPY